MKNRFFKEPSSYHPVFLSANKEITCSRDFMENAEKQGQRYGLDGLIKDSHLEVGLKKGQTMIVLTKDGGCKVTGGKEEAFFNKATLEKALSGLGIGTSVPPDGAYAGDISPSQDKGLTLP
ncbi:MAG: hypothetical protein V1746_01045 [bacterium]